MVGGFIRRRCCGCDGGAEGTVPSLQHQRLRLATGAKSLTKFQAVTGQLATITDEQNIAGRRRLGQNNTALLRLALLPDARKEDGEPRVALIGLENRPTIFATIREALAAKRAAEAVAHG